MASRRITPSQLELSEGPTELVRLYVKFFSSEGGLQNGKRTNDEPGSSSAAATFSPPHGPSSQDPGGHSSSHEKGPSPAKAQVPKARERRRGVQTTSKGGNGVGPEEPPDRNAVVLVQWEGLVKEVGNLGPASNKGGADKLIDLLWREKLIGAMMQPGFSLRHCVPPLEKKDVLEYVAGTGFAELPGSPVAFRQMAPAEAHEYLKAHGDAETWCLFTLDLLRSPTAYFNPMCEYFQSAEIDVVGELIRCLALDVLRMRERVLSAEWKTVKQQCIAGKTWYKRESMQPLWNAGRYALNDVAHAQRDFVFAVCSEICEYTGQKYKEALSMVHGHFTSESESEVEWSSLVRATQDTIIKQLEREEKRLAEVVAERREWVQLNFDLLREELPAVRALLHEIEHEAPSEVRPLTQVSPDSVPKFEVNLGALSKLGGRNFVQEASGLVQGLQLGLEAKWTAAFSSYIQGLGEAELPGRLTPNYREMAPDAIFSQLLQAHDAPPWWLFTLDLLRSPKAHFDAVCEYLRPVGLERFAAPVRSMAVGALRVRANELSKLRTEAGSGYDSAGTRNDPATRSSCFERWMSSAVGEAKARAAFLDLLVTEVKGYHGGKKYPTALHSVYAFFHCAENGVSITDLEEVLNQVGYGAEVLNDDLANEDRILEAAGSGNREWIKWNFDLLRKEREGLLLVLDELRLGEKELQEQEPFFEPLATALVNVPVIVKWVEQKLLAAGGKAHNVENMRLFLEGEDVLNHKDLQRELELAIGQRGLALMDELWPLPVSAVAAPDGIPRQLKDAAEQAAAELLRAESEADGKGSKKGKKKKKKKGAQPPEVPTPIPAGGEGDPFKPDEQRAVRTLDEIAPASRKDAPLALRGRNFAKEMPVLGALRTIGAGTEELTPEYVMGIVQSPSRVAEWCELTPAQAQEYLLAHPEDGTWWLFTLDFLTWPKARFDPMWEFLRRGENQAFALPIESMALGALHIRAGEYWERHLTARRAYFAKGKAQKEEHEQTALDTVVKELRDWMGEGATPTLWEYWLRLTIAGAATVQTLIAVYHNEAGGGKFADVLPKINGLYSAADWHGGSEPRVLRESLKGAPEWLERGDALIERASTVTSELAGPEDKFGTWHLGTQGCMLWAQRSHLSSYIAEVTFALSRMGPGPRMDYEPVHIKKVNMGPIMKWVSQKLLEELDAEAAAEQSEEIDLWLKELDMCGEALQLHMTFHLRDKAPAFMAELWPLLVSAQESKNGVSPQLEEAAEEVAESPSEWTDVSTHKKRGKAQLGVSPHTPPTSAPSRSPPTRPKRNNLSAEAAPEQRRKKKAQKSSRRQRDADGFADIGVEPGGNVGAYSNAATRGGSEVGSGRRLETERLPRPVEGQQGLPNSSRELQPTAAFSPKSPTPPHALDGLLEQPGAPLTLQPTSAEEEHVVSQNPECRGIRRPPSAAAPILSTGLETKKKRATLDVAPSVNSNPAAELGETAKAKPSVPHPLEPGSPSLHSPPVRASPGPRAPYNPFGGAPGQLLVTPTGHRNSKLCSVPSQLQASSSCSTEQNAQSPDGPSDSTAPLTSAAGSEEVQDHVLRLLTGASGSVNKTPQTPEAVSSAQRSLELESLELPSILSMLLPREDARPRETPARKLKPFTPPMLTVHRVGGDFSDAAVEGAGSSHVAACELVRTSPNGARWAEPGSMPDHIRAALEEYQEQADKEKPSPAARKAAKDNLREDVACCICFESPKNAALVPCGHQLCFQCSNTIYDRRGSCPLCNKEIQSVLKLFN